MIRAIVVFAVFYLSQTAGVLGQAEGPLGLTWGNSVSELRASGVELKDVREMNDFGKSYLASNLPRALSDQTTTVLSFGHDDKLWRIVLLGRAVDNNPAGYALKQRYEELKQTLEEKYGKPTTYHSVGDSFCAKDENFLYCIHSGKRFWTSSFSANQTLSIELSIHASSSSTGQWRIIFEELNGRLRYDGAKKALEKKAL